MKPMPPIVAEGERRLAEFSDYRARTAMRVDRCLRDLLPGPRVKPGIVHEAMRYTALSPGKRLRPVLVIMAYEAAGGRGRRADPVAAALEMVHAFSLIHDDLPCMDDDDVRRGQPSNHKIYGEGVAVLAGDALLTQAFMVLAQRRGSRALGPATTAALIEELASATGSVGVVGGQVLDLLSENKKVPRTTVEFIHRHKTARLFESALRLGGLAAGAPPGVLRALARYGDAVGMAFQIVDDLLGLAGTYRSLGRSPGRDQARGKATFPGVVGVRKAHAAVDRRLRRALAQTEKLPRHGDRFEGLIELLDRRRRDNRGTRLGLDR